MGLCLALHNLIQFSEKDNMLTTSSNDVGYQSFFQQDMEDYDQNESLNLEDLANHGTSSIFNRLQQNRAECEAMEAHFHIQ